MPTESELHNHENLGSLSGCLVEGDSQQRALERRIRRRSLTISILIQTTALAGLILIPLFGRTERLVLAHDAIFMPQPPAAPVGEVQRRRSTSSHAPSRSDSRPIFHDLFHPAPRIPTGIVTHDSDIAPPSSFPQNPYRGPIAPGIPGGTGPGPVVVEHTTYERRVVHVGQLDPAQLIHRVEPAYPAIPRQLGREGRVELRAIISTDGTIQSLQIVSGDPLFFQSAREAVLQWRYRPLILNGQPVEIDTYIIVLYTMHR